MATNSTGHGLSLYTASATGIAARSSPIGVMASKKVAIHCWIIYYCIYKSFSKKSQLFTSPTHSLSRREVVVIFFLCKGERPCVIPPPYQGGGRERFTSKVFIEMRGSYTLYMMFTYESFRRIKQ